MEKNWQKHLTARNLIIGGTVLIGAGLAIKAVFFSHCSDKTCGKCSHCKADKRVADASSPPNPRRSRPLRPCSARSGS